MSKDMKPSKEDEEDKATFGWKGGLKEGAKPQSDDNAKARHVSEFGVLGARS